MAVENLIGPQKGPEMTLRKISSPRAHSVMLGFTALATGVLIAACGSSSSSSSSASSSSSSSSTNTTSTTATSGQAQSAGGASNARSGPAAGGSAGTVSSVSTSGFDLLTSTGEKVTIKETSSSTYETGTTAASKSAVTKGQTVLVLGTDDNTTITATEVIVGPPKPNSKTASEVVSFNGSGDKTKAVGQIPASYKQGSGTILSGTTANKATEAALLTYPGGVVDRVVQLSNGEYEVHNIGVSWPHHIFVTNAFKVVGAND
jgi:hypothetical protein